MDNNIVKCKDIKHIILTLENIITVDRGIVDFNVAWAHFILQVEFTFKGNNFSIYQSYNRKDPIKKFGYTLKVDIITKYSPTPWKERRLVETNDYDIVSLKGLHEYLIKNYPIDKS